MKQKIFFLAIVLASIPLYVSSQSIFKENAKDDAIRSAYASYYLIEVQEAIYVFNTPFGEAAANIILKAYRDLLTIPEISLANMDATDKAKVEQLIIKLNQLTKNPPTWDEITIMEKESLIKWDQAVRLKSKYKSID